MRTGEKALNQTKENTMALLEYYENKKWNGLSKTLKRFFPASFFKKGKD